MFQFITFIIIAKYFCISKIASKSFELHIAVNIFCCNKCFASIWYHILIESFVFEYCLLKLAYMCINWNNFLLVGITECNNIVKAKITFVRNHCKHFKVTQKQLLWEIIVGSFLLFLQTMSDMSRWFAFWYS